MRKNAGLAPGDGARQHRWMRLHFPFLLLSGVAAGAGAPLPDKGPLAVQSLTGAEFRFGGLAGERITANIDAWLLNVPRANPGMLEMFRLRDRQPQPAIVPWAGEFAGKYLLSCVAALRESGRAELRAHIAAFVTELISTQADDGYLGPFPKERRLLGEWDLWGHYHVMQGLLSWHDHTGEAAALAAVERAAALICRTYLDGPRRVKDAGSPEMNMAVSHVMADLHRRTGDVRCLQLVREIEKDWEQAGDYLRTGIAGVPFYKTPLPRWESLHDLQTLTELWRLTGESRYRDAFSSHWRSILLFDVRNSGAFSGGEQATGNPYAPTAIETCCTVAWMALTLDMLRLHGTPDIADELERSTLNAAFAAQHPSGRWWTYNTPMDGDRKSSAHDIVFQARAGTPELNCCSVNGPRAPGMLADWSVMRDAAGFVINTHAPVAVTVREAAGAPVTLTCESRWPLEGDITWRITAPRKMRVRFRIPPWAEGATAALAGTPVSVKPGTYCDIEQDWSGGDAVSLHFPMPLRTVAGQREQAGKVSVYRGPLLLAWDQADNSHDEFLIPRLAPDMLRAAAAVNAPPASLTHCAPWVMMELPTSRGTLRLRDYATAGMSGTRYRSWLRAASATPPVPGGPPALAASLKTGPEPQSGTLVKATAFTAAGDAITLNGADQMFTYVLPDNFAAGDFTVSVRFKVHSVPDKRPAQVFSAWCAPGDDPLRLVIENGQLFARIEGSGGGSTGGVPLKPEVWHHAAAVREAGTLTLYLDGQPVASGPAPVPLLTKSKLCALGGNPLYTGRPEFLHASFRDFAIHTRVLSDDEVAALSK